MTPPVVLLSSATMSVRGAACTAQTREASGVIRRQQSGCRFGPNVPGFFLRKAGASCSREGCRRVGGGDAHPPVLLQFVLCALQFHPKIGREFPANLKIRRGKSFSVFASPDVKCSFQIPAAWATHFATCPSRSCCALNSTQHRVSGPGVLLSSSCKSG